MSMLFAIARRVLFGMDPERAHDLTVRALSHPALARMAAVKVPDNSVEIAGLRLRTPVGLAAGLDKNAIAVDGLLALGFGFVEIGGVTPKPQPGNPRPRAFRLMQDRAVINRYGLNSDGAEAVVRNLERQRRAGIVGVNLGANKDSVDRTADYAECLRIVGPHVDYATINVSSPNTPGLRALQDGAALTEIFKRLNQVRDQGKLSTPLFLKVAPDLTPEDITDISRVSLDLGIDGLVIANTTIARPDSLSSEHRDEAGGLSGAPLMAASTEVLARFRDATEGKMPLIGVGGIMSGADAAAKIRAGATAVQFYSGMIWRGPALIAEAAEAIAAEQKRQ
ncbi:MAG: quinone-dependent dihydroorotate dehydrogenase [Minwuia sp.]|nr:quinone-dependent dihydroorotate dehydrogenase [Minwuia sp.]